MEEVFVMYHFVMYLGWLPEVELSNISRKLVLQKCAEYSRMTSTVDRGITYVIFIVSMCELVKT